MTGRTVRGVLTLVAGLLLVVAWAGPAGAHARLVSSDPVGGATVAEPPEQITIDFSETIESSFGGIQVFGPDGSRLDAGTPVIAGNRLQLPIAPITSAGTYTVAFRVISADGHPIEASYTFALAPPVVTTTVPPAPAPGATDAAPDRGAEVATGAADDDPSPGGDDPPRPIRPVALEDAGPGTEVGLWLSRAASYAALTALIGLLAVAAVVLPPDARTGAAARRARQGAKAAATALAATGVLLFTFGLSNAAARPLADVLTGDLLGRFAGTRFGTVVLAQVALALVVLVVLGVVRHRRGTATALVVAGVAALAPPLWGHAGTDELGVLAVANDWLHLLAVTAWVCGLAAVAWLHLRRSEPPLVEAAAPVAVLAYAGPVGPAGPPEPDSTRPAAPGAAGEGSDAAPEPGTAPVRVVERYSRMAGWALLVVAVTGVANAALHLGALGALADTGWGRLVLVKAALLGVLALLGLAHRQRILPRLAGGGGEGRRLFGRVVAGELLVMAVAVGIATQMAAGIPADAERAARIQSFATPFGPDGQLNVTVDPARSGDNIVHLYFLDAQGRIDDRPVDPTLRVEQQGAQLSPTLVRTGPGHYSAFGAELPRSGEWLVRVGAGVGGEDREATGRVVVR